MKRLLTTFFILNTILLTAQVEQTEASTEASSIQPVLTCKQIVKGEVRNKRTTNLLLGAEVVLSDQNGNVLQTITVNDDATFSFEVKCETAYRLEGKKEEFTPESANFTTSNEADKELKLVISLGKGNIDFITNAKAEKATVKIVEVKTEIVPDIKLDEIKKVVPEIVPKPVLQKKKVESTVNINPIYFDYESSYLSKKAKVDLQKIVGIMNQYPKMIVECAGHTDSKGPDNYNIWMADRRVKRAIDYIVKRGVSANRITGKGYGATQLMNHCGEDVECTEKEQAMNRRTAFVVVKM